MDSKKAFSIIDTVIVNLDRLTVRGITNLGLVIESINALGALKELVQQAEKEARQDVPNQAQ